MYGRDDVELALYALEEGMGARGAAELAGDWDDYHEDWRWWRLTEAADAIGYEWTGAAHGSLADALATLAVQKWVERERGLER